ncbi:MAG: phage antirepressor N-terminal domain-containing protein [Chloroflexota bacterium]
MEQELQVLEQKEVQFYDDELVAVRASDGQIYVSVRHMCRALGMKRPQRQTDRMQRNEVLADGLQRVPIMGTRGRQQAYVFRADLVPLWLTTIDTSRVGEEVKPKIVRYQREAGKVLWEAFQNGRLTTEPAFDDLLQQETEAVQAYKMAMAVVKLARNQILIEARMDRFDERLEQIEAQLGDADRYVTEAQASRLSQAVKAVAMALSKQTRKNEFGGVYGELYRRYDITGYKMLPTRKFDDAMKFLTEWHQSIAGEVPF